MSESSTWKNKYIKSCPNEPHSEELSKLTDDEIKTRIEEIANLKSKYSKRLFEILDILSNGGCEDSKIKGLNDEADSLEKTLDKLYRQEGECYKEVTKRSLLRIKEIAEKLNGNGR